MDCPFFALINIEFLDIISIIFLCMKKWNFNWNKNIAGKFVAMNDPVIWCFPTLFGAHPQMEMSGWR